MDAIWALRNPDIRMSEHVESDKTQITLEPLTQQEWTWRYDNARRILDSPTRMAINWHLAYSLDAAPEPGGRIVHRRKMSYDRAMMKELRAARHIMLMPGSFNPITVAHQALSYSALLWNRDQALFRDAPSVIIWSYAIATINKEGVERASLVDRLAQLAAFGDRERPSPPIIMLFNRGLYLDQVRALRALLHPDATIQIIVGFDKIVQIFDPRYYADRDASLQQLFSLATVLVAPRDGAGVTDLAAFLALRENAPWADHVHPLDAPARFNALSSTRIRELAATEPDAMDLRSNVPPEALALIRETGAYAQFRPAGPDLYALRQQWLRAFSSLPTDTLRALPSISQLVRRAAAQDADGAAMQNALADGRWAGDPERAINDLRALGLLRRRPAQDSGGRP
jgi:nicotinic acid mononucleotide adenylyltransferase